ncbi:MAG: hypothetical protein JSR48_12075 [Verrucomicrobia bacterium]|nr:hypothetical protein [Verrucomicrobiota bacterium]
MPGIELESLSARQQQLVAKAEAALAAAQHDYVLEVTGDVLREVPACVKARRLQHAARRALWGSRRSFGRAGRARLALLRLMLRPPATPIERLRACERMIALDPTFPTPFRLFAEAAIEQGWPENAVFAREVLRALRPADRDNAVALGEALIGAGRPAEALAIAEEVLRTAPADGLALELLRHASIAKTMAEDWARTSSAVRMGSR